MLTSSPATSRPPNASPGLEITLALPEAANPYNICEHIQAQAKAQMYHSKSLSRAEYEARIHTGKSPQVFGKAIDSQTRCIHWHSPRDIVALQFYCCRSFYPCYQCHEEDVKSADAPNITNERANNHKTLRWPNTLHDHEAVLCGSCKKTMTIRTYVELYEGDNKASCPSCDTDFNPGCRNHLGLYFEVESSCQITGVTTS